MTLSVPDSPQITIRPLQYRDLEAIESLVVQYCESESCRYLLSLGKPIEQLRYWYGPLKLLSWFPNPYQHNLRVYVAEQFQQIVGFIQVSPFNRTRSTWRVEKVIVNRQIPQLELLTGKQSIGSQLLRHCFETIWEARTWVLEVNIHDRANLGLYREHGFQPLAQMTYWAIEPEQVQRLAQNVPDLPNLLPVSNADAQLLYQLDCVSMPPLLRQVFDRHIQDFKIGMLKGLVVRLRQWLTNSEVTKGYVFEPQRKAAIGYFQLDLSKDASSNHKADLTVHPAYTWLYPQLLAQMTQIVKDFPAQNLELASADYQPEREEFLEKIGAERIDSTLLMSRSVWHKLRETKPLETLQLSDVLQGLKPVRTPIPTRMSWLESMSQNYKKTTVTPEIISPESKLDRSGQDDNSEPPQTTGNGHHA